MKLIINIPAYNEEKAIASTIANIKKSFQNEFYFSGKGQIFKEKLVQVVDDGSSDQTTTVARNAGADLIVSYKPNRRLAYAFKRAVENALENKVDILVNIDADGQFRPEEIPRLLEPILDGKADMTIGNRFGKHEAKDIPFIKDFLNRFAAKVIGIFLGEKISDLTCGFRAHNQETLLRLNLTNENFTYTQETIIDAIGKRLKLKWVPINVIYFENRQSRIVSSVWKFVGNGFKIILKAIRDVRPLKFFGWPGLFFIFISLLGFGFFLFHYLQNFKITPYLNYIFFSSITLLLGIQLLIFAFIADMIKSSRKISEEILYQRKRDALKK